MSHFCEFCQTTHTAQSCYHPGAQRIEALQAEVEATCAALKVALAESTWMVTQRDADTTTIEALQAERDAMRPDAAVACSR